MEKPFFIVNPVAGSGKSGRHFAQIEAMLRERGMEYGVAFTQHPMHGVTLAREALEAGERFIVAVGGDGTVNEVASALVGSDAVMGILPFGTGNDMARPLRIPEKPEEAFEIILNAKPRAMDAGLANGRFFLNMSGFGFDVDVLVYTERYKKRLNGMLPYLMGIVSALSHLRTLRIKVDAGEEQIETNAVIIAVGNGTHYGGGMMAAPDADPFDGLFDVCIVEHESLLKLLTLLPAFIKGKHRGRKLVRYFRAKELYVESDKECVLNIDGELDSQAPVKYSVLPGAINILTGC